MAATKAEANAAFDFFVEAYGVKYAPAVKCLTKDRADLLAFHDFPAEHWKHIRTTNPIESTDPTVRHRTTKTRGCLPWRFAPPSASASCLSAWFFKSPSFPTADAERRSRADHLQSDSD